MIFTLHAYNGYHYLSAQDKRWAVDDDYTVSQLFFEESHCKHDKNSFREVSQFQSSKEKQCISICQGMWANYFAALQQIPSGL